MPTSTRRATARHGHDVIALTRDGSMWASTLPRASASSRLAVGEKKAAKSPRRQETRAEGARELPRPALE